MMKISEMIGKLQAIKEEHGDLDVYGTYDGLLFEYDEEYSPVLSKIYTRKGKEYKWMEGKKDYSDADNRDENLYDADLSKPINKALIL